MTGVAKQQAILCLSLGVSCAACGLACAIFSKDKGKMALILSRSFVSRS